MLLASTTLLALAALPQDAAAADDSAAPEVRITFLANDGFLIASGEHSVVIDGFVPQPHDVYEALPPEVYERMSSGSPPFEGVVLGLVSHKHRDHFQPRAAERFLAGNELAGILSSPQVVRELKKNIEDKSLLPRALVVDAKPGESQVIMQEHMSVEMFRLKHGGEGNSRIVNYGHLITIGGLKILHVGDVEVSDEAFANLDLASRSIDVAFIPYWFFGSEEGIRIVREKVAPAQVVACHIPPTDRERLIELMKVQLPNVRIFREPMDSVVLRGREVEPNPRRSPMR